MHSNPSDDEVDEYLEDDEADLELERRTGIKNSWTCRQCGSINKMEDYCLSCWTFFSNHDLIIYGEANDDEPDTEENGEANDQDLPDIDLETENSESQSGDIQFFDSNF